MFFYISFISSHSLITLSSFSKVLRTSKSQNGFLVSTYVCECYLALTSFTLSVTRTDAIAFGCVCLCLLTLSPGGLLSGSHNFNQRDQGFLGDEKHPSLKGMRGSIDICPLTTGRNLIWNFVQLGAYLQSHYKSCPWNMIGSASLDKLRIPVRIHWEPTLLTAIIMGFILLPALHSPHSFFVVIHLNLFLCSYSMIFWQLFV